MQKWNQGGMRIIQHFLFKFVILTLIIGYFSILIFTVETRQNKFICYDDYYLCIVTFFALLSFTLLIIQIRCFKVSQVDILLAFFALYVMLNLIFTGSLNFSYCILLLSLSVVFLFFRTVINLYNYRLINIGFIISFLLIACYMGSGTRIFQSKIYSQGLATINPGEEANYLALTGPYLLSLFLQNEISDSRGKVIKYLSGIAFAICCGMLIKTTARIAWIGAGVGVIYVMNSRYALWVKLKQYLNSNLKKIIFSLAMLISIVVFVNQLYRYKPDSVRGRMLIYEVSSKMLNSRLLGIGLGNFSFQFNSYQSKYFSENQVPVNKMLLAGDVQYVFNEYYQAAIELGVLGLAFIIAGGILLYNFVYKINDNKNLSAIGSRGSLVALSICCLASYPLHSTSILVYLMFLLAAASVQSKPVQQLPNFKLTMVGSYFILALFLKTTYFCILSEFRRIEEHKKWELAAYYALSGEFMKAKPIYNSIYPSFNNNGKFLFNYGVELLIAGEYKESLTILERASRYYSESNLYLYLGNCYRACNKLHQAEISYLYAINMVPSKFQPKYMLLLLYDELHDISKGRKLAKEIVDFPVKIPSSKVDEIKFYAQTYLSKGK